MDLNAANAEDLFAAVQGGVNVQNCLEDFGNYSNHEAMMRLSLSIGVGLFICTLKSKRNAVIYGLSK